MESHKEAGGYVRGDSWSGNPKANIYASRTTQKIVCKECWRTIEMVSWKMLSDHNIESNRKYYNQS